MIKRNHAWQWVVCVVLFVACFFIFSSDVMAAKFNSKLQSKKTQSHLKHTYVVRRVIDGDTFLLSNGKKVRLTGIDTPESVANVKAYRDQQRTNEDIKSITHNGKKAKQFVREMIEGKKVRIEYDVQKLDRYGRPLVYVFDVQTLKFNPEIKHSKGVFIVDNEEIFINGTIIRAGYAKPLTVPPNVKYAHLFHQLYEEARSQKRGLWAQSY